MKVSIITATFNSEEFIKDCLVSISNQTYKNIEHIIVDGKSTDRTINIINRFKKNKKFCRIYSEKDNGIYDALNKGIKLASGDIIIFLHSDDVFFSGKTVENIVNFIEENKLDGLYGNLLYVSKNKNKIIRKWKSSTFDIKKLKFGWMAPHPTLVLRNFVYDKIGLFDLRYKISSDYDFILRVFKSKDLNIKYLDEFLVNMRIGGISNDTNYLIKKLKEDISVLEKNNVGSILTVFFKISSKIQQFF